MNSQSVCAVVLAGGRGARMGGVDKGLQLFRGQALAMHAVQRLQAQTWGAPGLIAINANRNQDDYATWGTPVWPDAQQDFSGPLAGFQTALHHCRKALHAFDFLLMVPCDSPLFPLDLLERLAVELAQTNADIAMVAIPQEDNHGVSTIRAQPVFCLLRTTLWESLRDFMAQGGRKIGTWTGQQHTVEVRFDTPNDDPHDFFNANTLDQLQQLEQS
jgi:molybdopterin-guanine dinucleotide biosynthesis protein A